MTAPNLWIRLLAASAVLLLLVVGTAPPPSRAEKPPEDVAAASISVAARLTGETQVSPVVTPTDWDNYLPAVAYSSKHRQFLIVWHAKRADGCRDIWGRRVSEAGQLLSYFNISSGPCPENRFQPAVAYNALDDNYMVVWMHNPSGTGLTDENAIRGRTVAWDGATMGTEHQVWAWTHRSFWTPHVAWNSIRNEYEVVWSAFDTTTGLPSDVAGAVLDHNGVVVWGAVIFSTANHPHQVDVTYNLAADEYFVVWRRLWTPADGDIMGARVTSNGHAVVNPPGEFGINTLTTDQREPRVTTNQQHRYLVVWSQVYNPAVCCDWDIWGQELDVNGNLVGSFTIIASTTDDETVPAVIARPGPTRDYMAAWQVDATNGDAIQAVRWGDPAVSGGLLDVASAAFWDNTQPAVGVGGSAFLLAYASDAVGDPTVHNHIYMRRFSPYATYLPVTRR